MSRANEALIQEFTRLRHGWGLADNNLGHRVGPHLVELCEILPDDSDKAIRTKVLNAVKRWSSDFPYADQLAAEVALGGSPGTQHRLLQERVSIIASRLKLSERTARRHIDRAFARLAEEAAADRSHPVDVTADDPERGWYVRRFDALLRLDRPNPEVTETRTIVAVRPGLRRIAIRFSLPGPHDDATASRELLADIAHGARIESTMRDGGHFRYVLALPRSLARDEEHTYTVVFRLPPGQVMRQHYAMVPLVRVDSFQARIRFAIDHLPEAVWRFDHLAPQIMREPHKPGTPLAIDGAGEVMQRFPRPEQGFGYGLAWQYPGEPPP